MYAVFGMTKELARNLARKKVKTHKPPKNIPKSFSEYKADLEKEEMKIFLGKSIRQLSSIYSNKREADQFIDLAKKIRRQRFAY